jgi:hypothetical protein
MENVYASGRSSLQAKRAECRFRNIFTEKNQSTQASATDFNRCKLGKKLSGDSVSGLKTG